MNDVEVLDAIEANQKQEYREVLGHLPLKKTKGVKMNNRRLFLMCAVAVALIVCIVLSLTLDSKQTQILVPSTTTPTVSTTVEIVADRWDIPHEFIAPSYPHRKKHVMDKLTVTLSDAEHFGNKSRQCFQLSRMVMGSRSTNRTNPFLTIVTRTYKRPMALQRNRDRILNVGLRSPTESLLIEHVILEDLKGGGMQVAEAALFAFREEFHGDYIVHCDDDDYVCAEDMVTTLWDVVQENGSPPLIVFKVNHEPRKELMPNRWQAFPMEGNICTNCVLFRRDLYMKVENIGAIAQRHGGDFAFIHNCFLDTKPSEVVWLDRILMTVTKDRDETNWPCVTSKIQGGLGNQLFQIAAALDYSKQANHRVGFDKSKNRVSEDSHQPRPTYWSDFLSRVPELSDINLNQEYKEIRENRFAFEELPIYYQPVCLIGWFQSWTRVRRVLSELGSMLTWPRPISKMEENTVAIHFRMTDYKGSSLHTNLSLTDYYQPAIQFILNQSGSDSTKIKWKIFSDDPDAVMNLVEQEMLPEEAEIIREGTDVEQLQLMMECQHHIIANSTFSWWAAILSRSIYSDQNVYRGQVAPQKWFLADPVEMDWSGLYHGDWHLI